MYRCIADNAVRPPATYDATLYINFKPNARPVQSSYGQAENRMYDITIECIIAGTHTGCDHPTACAHLHRLCTLALAVHTCTGCAHSSNLSTLTQNVHIHTSCPHPHRLSTLKQAVKTVQCVNTYTSCPHPHRLSTLKQSFHTHTGCSDSHRLHTLTQAFHSCRLLTQTTQKFIHKRIYCLGIC